MVGWGTKRYLFYCLVSSSKRSIPQSAFNVRSTNAIWQLCEPAKAAIHFLISDSLLSCEAPPRETQWWGEGGKGRSGKGWANKGRGK